MGKRGKPTLGFQMIGQWRFPRFYQHVCGVKRLGTAHGPSSAPLLKRLINHRLITLFTARGTTARQAMIAASLPPSLFQRTRGACNGTIFNQIHGMVPSGLMPNYTTATIEIN
jgi:hypothetical protein